MGENVSSESKLVEFNLPTTLIEKMKKLSKIRGHSIDDEFVEAIEVHVKEEKSSKKIPLSSDNTDASIEEQFAKDQELRKSLDKEVSLAVKKHLKRHTGILK